MQVDEQPEFGDELARAYGTSSAVSDPRVSEAARTAFLDFVSREYPGVIVFLMQYGALRADAEDATQEAFIDAWQLTKEPGRWEAIRQPRAWIRKVAYRKLMRPPGPRRRIQAYPVADMTAIASAVSVADHAEPIILTDLVCSILRNLDEDTRLVMAYVMDEFEPHEIAAELGMTTQRVYDLRKKGRKALSAGLIVAPREQDRREM